MVKKMEVGKKYRSKNTPVVYTCVGIDISGRPLLQRNANAIVFTTLSADFYEEYKDPLSYDKWHPIVQGKDGTIFLSGVKKDTKEEALKSEIYHGAKVIDAIRVSWVEEEH